jgi:ketol-acid reductoisomerase
MKNNRPVIYSSHQADVHYLQEKTIAVIGYGNQGRAQALNLRDNKIHVIIGNQEDRYRQYAINDKFEVTSIHSAIQKADICFLLLPDEVLPTIYTEQILPNLKTGGVLVFASGYNIAFNQIEIPNYLDILLIAPRMIGAGVRERFLSGEGFYCFVDVHQDFSNDAESHLLALLQGIGGFLKPAIRITMKQEATLDLFNEQAFGPAFGQVLLSAISVLIDNGLPPEAVLVEMYMSEEMAYTYRKMAKTGLVKQTDYHSQTSQYGAMSRGIRFMNLGLKSRMQKIFQEIDNGSFAREWGNPLTKIKFAAIKYFATRQRINTLETEVRASLGTPSHDIFMDIPEYDGLLCDPNIKQELELFEKYYNF